MSLFATRTLFFYILRELLKVFILAALAMMLVMNFGAVIVYLRKFDLPIESLLKLMPYRMPILFTWVLPLAALMASTLAYGRLASDNEILAMKMSGMHLIRPVLPALLLGLVLSAALAFANDVLLPWCLYREYEVFAEESDRVLISIFNGPRKQKEFGSFTIEWKSCNGRVLEDMVLKKHYGDKLLARYRARRATFRSDGSQIHLDMEDIVMEDYKNKLTAELKERAYMIPLKGVFAHKPGYKSLNTLQLLRSLDEKYGDDVPLPYIETANSPEELEEIIKRETKKRKKRIFNIWARIHERFGLAASAFAFVLVGVPLGLLSRQGHTLSAFFLGCLPVMLVFYPILLLGQSLAERGSIPVEAAFWTPVAVLGTLGGALLLKLFTR